MEKVCSSLTPKLPKFPIGLITISRRAAALLTFDQALTALSRHISADWGLMIDNNWQRNQSALVTGGRLISVFDFDARVQGHFYVITEPDRTSTTILLSSEY